MAKLSKNDSGKLFGMIGKPGWEALMKLVAMTISDLNSREVAGQNEFETLRALHTIQGKVDGLTEFFNGIENGESLTDIDNPPKQYD